MSIKILGKPYTRADAAASATNPGQAPPTVGERHVGAPEDVTAD